MKTFKVGDRVRVNTPDEPQIHNMTGRIIRKWSTGVHVVEFEHEPFAVYSFRRFELEKA